MALTGLQATCGFAGDKTSSWNAKQAVFAWPQWSETMAIPASGSKIVPADGMIMHYKAAAECYLVQAPAPNASLAVSTSQNSARIHMNAGETLDVYAKFLDKIDVVAATLNGLHVTCGFAGFETNYQSAKEHVFAFPVWSETLNGTAVTTQSAPSNGCVFHIKTSAEYYFAVGTSPDATLAVSTNSSSARINLEPGLAFDIYVRGGFKLACALA